MKPDVETQIEFSVVYESMERLEKAIQLSSRILTAFDSDIFNSNIYDVALIINYQYIDVKTSEMILRSMPAGQTMYDVKNHREYSEQFKRHADLYTKSIDVPCVQQNINYKVHDIENRTPEEILINNYIHVINILLHIFVDRGQFTKNDMEQMNNIDKELMRLWKERRIESDELAF